MDNVLLLTAAVGALVGACIAWVLLRSRGVLEFERGKVVAAADISGLRERQDGTEKQLATASAEVTRLRARELELLSEKDRIGDELSTAKARAERIPGLDAELARVRGEGQQSSERVRQLSADLARAEQLAAGRASEIADLTAAINRTETERDAAEHAANEFKNMVAALTAQLEGEKRQVVEKIDLLKQAETTLRDQFSALGEAILEQKAIKFTEQGKAVIEGVLAPMREKLIEFSKTVEETYDREARDRLLLKEEIKRLTDLNRQVSDDTKNLTSALKGEGRMQGAWGEMILERVLERSGLKKGAEYEVQSSFTDEEGRKQRPDAIVHLPDRKHVIIDAKVSLTDYERYVSAPSEEEGRCARDAHAASVRRHCKGLGERNYQQIVGLRSPDFVLMFVPIEGAFRAAVEANDKLFEDAFMQNVIIVSPSTLLAVLRMIANVWRQEHRNLNAEEIARRGALLYGKFVKFVGEMQGVGNRLIAAQECYDTAFALLSRGNGNLVRQAEMLRQLGVKPSSTLPEDLVEGSVEPIAIAALESAAGSD